MSIEKWNSLEKDEFLNCVEKKDFDSFRSLSCFMDFSSVRGETARKLLEKILFDFSEDDLDIQEKMYYLLDMIIDGITQVSFKNYRKFFKIKNANEIDNILLTIFKKANNESDINKRKIVLEGVTNNFIENIVKDSSYYEECYDNVLKLFEEYGKNLKISKDTSSDFYNELLNRQRNNYVSEEKFVLISLLCNKLSYTERKRKSLIVSAKLKKIDNYLKKREYSKMGVSIDALRGALDGFEKYFNSLKSIRRDGIVITEEQVSLMNKKFLEGSLDPSIIYNICSGITEKSANVIYDKYTQVKLKYLAFIDISDDELSDIDLGYNYNNYKIITKENYYENLVKLFSNIKQEDAEKILVSADVDISIFLLVLFVDYFSVLDIKSVISILKNYSRIVENIGVENLDNNIYLGIPFDKLYFLSKAYENADDITLAVLGDDVIEKIVTGGGGISKNPRDYVNVYLKMLGRENNFIPSINGEYGSCYYESGHDSDVERLLIGKNCDLSCVDLDGAGEEAYLSCLTGCLSDVIVFRDKESNDFVARSLLFRAGNFVVLAPIYGTDGIEEDLYNEDLLRDISTKILSRSSLSQDNIDYVLLAYFYNKDLESVFPLLTDENVSDNFPHADLYTDYFVIGNNTNSENVLIDSSAVMLKSYDRNNDSVRSGDFVTNTDYNKIRALEVFMIEDDYEREYAISNFKFESKSRFDNVFLGQDWYVALQDGTIAEKTILPTSRKGQKDEILELCKELQQIGYNISNDDVIEMMFSDAKNTVSSYSK